MRNKRNKILTALLITALLLQGGMTAAAQEYTTEGTAECQISCQVTSTYTVSIPATVGLTYTSDTGKAVGNYQVGVKGDLLLNQMVEVEPSMLTQNLVKGLEGTYLQGSIKGEKTNTALAMTVTQVKSRWYPGGTTPLYTMGEYVEISSSEFVYAAGTVSSDPVQVADTYAGTLVFTFGLKDYAKMPT